MRINNINKLIITGDIHANWPKLNILINKKQPDAIICCGDFGYWPGFYLKPFNIKNKIKNKHNNGNRSVPIFWCPGNHENWDDLEEKYGRFGDEPIELKEFPNIFYCPIGSTLNINNKKFLFLGGADSIDKDSRMLGYDWFQQEILNLVDFYHLEKKSYGKVDVIISHTCPLSFNINKAQRYDKVNDPTRVVLDEMLKKIKPDNWIFGHWHFSMEGKYMNTNWVGLDYPRHNGRWWMEYKLGD